MVGDGAILLIFTYVCLHKLDYRNQEGDSKGQAVTRLNWPVESIRMTTIMMEK